MRTDQWSQCRFKVLDLVARPVFRSASSISFHLGRHGSVLAVDDATFDVPDSGVFNIVGSLDVHHPCEGHIKAYVRVVLPSQYHRFEHMKHLIDEAFARLEIPANETFHMEFIVPATETCMTQPVDRDGFSDRTS